MNNREIAQRILEMMKSKNIQQKELAKRINLKQQIVSDWMNGRSKSYLKYLDQIAEALGTTTEYLTTGKASPAEELYNAYQKAPENIREGIRKILNM